MGHIGLRLFVETIKFEPRPCLPARFFLGRAKYFFEKPQFLFENFCGLLL